MATQLERTEKTLNHIITVATELFATKGYADTSLAEVVEKSGMTTGVVYHHFKGKKGLFIAVAERVEQGILDEIVANVRDIDRGWRSFEHSVLTTVEICTRPGIQRIVFQEAPTVVGAIEWRKIEINYGFGMMYRALESLQSEGVIAVQNLELTANMILGAIIEAANFVAMAENKKQALEDAKITMRGMLSALPVK